MKKLVIFLVIVASLLYIHPRTSFAQGMMGGYQGQTTLSQSDLQDEQNMQDAGQKIYQNLQDKKITCPSLTNDDYEKLGEYFMGQAAGSTQSHVYWDQRIQQMMGDTGDTQMHIVWGERGSGCLTNAPLPANTPSFVGGMMNYQNSNLKGGGFNMMGWGGYGDNGITGWNGNFGVGAGVMCVLFWFVAFVDLVFLGIFLWKKIRK